MEDGLDHGFARPLIRHGGGGHNGGHTTSSNTSAGVELKNTAAAASTSNGANNTLGANKKINNGHERCCPPQQKPQAPLLRQLGQFPPLPYSSPSFAAEPPRDTFYLEVLKNGQILYRHELGTSKGSGGDGRVVFGRLPNCDIAAEHASISRYHCVLQYSNDGHWYAYDLGSTHGTRLNKVPAPSRRYCRLRIGQMLRLGASSRIYVLCATPEMHAAEEERAEVAYVASAREKKKKLLAMMAATAADEERISGERAGRHRDGSAPVVAAYEKKLSQEDDARANATNSQRKRSRAETEENEEGTLLHVHVLQGKEEEEEEEEEDTFYDRSGDVERKRKARKRQRGQGPVVTYATLKSRREKLRQDITDILTRLDAASTVISKTTTTAAAAAAASASAAASSAGGDSSNADTRSVEAYLSANQARDDTRRMQFRLARLRKEMSETEALLVTLATGLEKQGEEEGKEEEGAGARAVEEGGKGKEGKVEKVEEEKKKGEKVGKKTAATALMVAAAEEEEKKEGGENLNTSTMQKPPPPHSTTTTTTTITDSDRRRVHTVAPPPTLQQPASSLSLPSPLQTTTPTLSAADGFVRASVSVVTTGDGSDILGYKAASINTSRVVGNSGDGVGGGDVHKKRQRGGRRGRKAAKSPQVADSRTWSESDVGEVDTWAPPKDQTGDGRTSLNDKLGY